MNRESGPGSLKLAKFSPKVWRYHPSPSSFCQTVYVPVYPVHLGCDEPPLLFPFVPFCDPTSSPYAVVESLSHLSHLSHLSQPGAFQGEERCPRGALGHEEAFATGGDSVSAGGAGAVALHRGQGGAGRGQGARGGSANGDSLVARYVRGRGCGGRLCRLVVYVERVVQYCSRCSF